MKVELKISQYGLLTIFLRTFINIDLIIRVRLVGGVKK